MFRKVLVANRGEIAVRILRALRELGIRSVAVYSDADRGALHVRMADEAVHIGPAPSPGSYLRIDRILEAAHRRGAEAIHPGYGFLSENPDFAAACEAAGIVFVGPSSDAIRRLGSKTEARRLAAEAGVAVVPGTSEPVSNVAEARKAGAALGYPVLLKASAGGGGKGMRRVGSPVELDSALRETASEAERSFRNPAVYVEKLIERPRHIEIQVFGDRHGGLIHLGERECSIQRRHQKIVEECPSPLVASHPELRYRMGEAALRVARAVRYSNAGTVEFLVDAGGDFYFLEMNTRLQVEHPVTELVTGLDLVHLQLKVAAGQALPLAQEDVSWRGAAIECRIYAEDPDNHFYPSPGRVTQIDRPAGPGIRLDSGVYPGWVVPIDYDPLLAKLAVWAGTRTEAVVRMIRALEEYYVAGIKTNLTFFRQLLEDENYLAGRLHTGFVEEYFANRSVSPPDDDPDLLNAAAVVAALACGDERAVSPRNGASIRNGQPASRWRASGREEMLR